jgi:hypothetical protein
MVLPKEQWLTLEEFPYQATNPGPHLHELLPPLVRTCIVLYPAIASSPRTLECWTRRYNQRINPVRRKECDSVLMWLNNVRSSVMKSICYSAKTIPEHLLHHHWPILKAR